MLEIILPIILGVGLIGTFVYLGIKKKKTESNVGLVVKEEDKIDYSPQESTLTIFESALLNEINNHRTLKQLRIVKAEKECRTLANEHVKYMISKGKPSHDNAYKRRYELIRRGFTSYGENVAYGYSSAGSMFQAYLKSDGHRRVIEDPRYNYVGVKISKDNNGRNYNALIFSTYD